LFILVIFKKSGNEASEGGWTRAGLTWIR